MRSACPTFFPVKLVPAAYACSRKLAGSEWRSGGGCLRRTKPTRGAGFARRYFGGVSIQSDARTRAHSKSFRETVTSVFPFVTLAPLERITKMPRQPRRAQSGSGPTPYHFFALRDSFAIRHLGFVILLLIRVISVIRGR